MSDVSQAKYVGLLIEEAAHRLPSGEAYVRGYCRQPIVFNDKGEAVTVFEPMGVSVTVFGVQFWDECERPLGRTLLASIGQAPIVIAEGIHARVSTYTALTPLDPMP